MSVEDFTKTSVWQSAFKLLIRIYEITRYFPSEEKLGLVSDMRRAANSVVHNIAEGFGRSDAKDKTRFYEISRGSGYELISQLLVSHELRYLVNKAELNDLIDCAKKIIEELNAWIKTVET